jgi:LysR family nitrogen assimilation transcriptional regulator
MEFRELRYFMHVARAGSFSQAAGELNIAQPALSRQVRKLEQSLGVDLLIRHGRGVRLTSAGAVLLERADAIAQMLHQTAEQVKLSHDVVTGHVTLGVPPAAGLLLVPPLVTQFRSRFPHVSLHVREGISSMLQEWVPERRVDAAVLYNPPPLESIQVLPVLQERMVLVGPPPSRRRRGTALETCRIQDIGDLPLLMPSMPHNNRRVLEQAAIRHGVKVRIVLEIDGVALTKSMVRRGFGYTILTYASVYDEVERGELQARFIERPPLLATLSIVRLRDERGAQLPKELETTVREVLFRLVDDGNWKGVVRRGEPRARPARVL